MTCKFCNSEGICDLWTDDPNDIQFEHIEKSCNEFGHCLVEEDEDPSISCEDYEK